MNWQKRVDIKIDVCNNMFKMILRGEINMVRLKDIASISTGMTFGSKPEPLIGSHVRLMQLGNLDVSGKSYLRI